MSKHPNWAIRHRRKGTELRLINGRYYLYEVTSKWNPAKKRSQKITGKLLGSITEQRGFIESPKRLLQKKEPVINTVEVKEYGITGFISSQLKDYEVFLTKYFPKHWQSIIALVYCRLAYQCPLKNVEFHFQNSYLSELYTDVSLSAKKLSSVLREIGSQRSQIVSFFKEFGNTQDNILFDGTDLVSNSKKMSTPQKGKSKKGTFETLVNLKDFIRRVISKNCIMKN